MIKIGTVKSLWRYPVKGMAGESINTIEINKMGIHGDRLMAVQDVARQEIQSCKFRPSLLQCRASYKRGDQINQGVKILFPDGESFAADDMIANKKISALLGYESLLQGLRPSTEQDFYRRYKEDDHTWLKELKATFEREPGEPLPDLDNLPEEAQTFVSQLGSFFLVSSFHIITTASVNHLRKLNSSADWNMERFRPNLVIETLPELEGLIEQEWLSLSIKFGDVTIKNTEAAPRCGAVVRKQQSFEQDTSILRTIVAEADQNLGIYGDIVASGTASVGDSVYLCD